MGSWNGSSLACFVRGTLCISPACLLFAYRNTDRDHSFIAAHSTPIPLPFLPALALALHSLDHHNHQHHLTLPPPTLSPSPPSPYHRDDSTRRISLPLSTTAPSPMYSPTSYSAQGPPQWHHDHHFYLLSSTVRMHPSERCPVVSLPSYSQSARY